MHYRTTLPALLAATMLFSGCASYHRFRPTASEHAGIRTAGSTGDMNDAAVITYTDQVRDILRKRFHVARNVRQTAASAQVLLAGAAGLAGAFEAGATTVAALASGSVAIPQLSDVFDSGGRAIAYQQAVAKISEAEGAYFLVRAGRSPVVPANALTVEGALLLDAVNAATSAVELFQAGMLPTLDQMKRLEATELRSLAATKEKRLATGGTGIGGGGSGPAHGTTGAQTKEELRKIAAAQLGLRRSGLVAKAERLKPDDAAQIVGNPTMEDAEARIHLTRLINEGSSENLAKLDAAVDAKLNPPTIPIVIPPLDPTLPPDLDKRRNQLKADIAALPAGKAATILKTPALSDAAAKKRLTELAEVAMDPGLANLERDVPP